MKNKNDFIRSQINPGAVLNTDNIGLEAYKRQKMKNKRDELAAEELQNVKKEMSEVKQMLSLILERLK